MTKTYLGRHVFGAAAVLFGVITLIWRQFNTWQQIDSLGHISHPEILVYMAAGIELLGGVAIQWPSTRRAGAAALGAIYLVFALLWLPHIIAHPLSYDRWGNFFEQFSLVSGALVIYGAAHPVKRDGVVGLARLGYMFFGICVISFTVEQVAYLSATATFVPKWIPPGQMFWAVATTIAFALAAIALLTGRYALLASRLTTLMILGFGLLVWLPIVVADPHKLFSWAGNAQNLAIAGAAWSVADFLSQSASFRSASLEPSRTATRRSETTPEFGAS
jgi:hypothetical protein